MNFEDEQGVEEEMTSRKRVVNGAFATIKQLPWHVSLLVRGRESIPDAYLCAGVLIDRYWIVSFFW